MDLLMSKLDTLQEKLHQMEQNLEKNENARQKSVLGAETSAKTLEDFLVARDIGFLRGKLDAMERSTMAREESFRVKLEEMERSIKTRDGKLNCLEQQLQDIVRNQSTKEFCHRTNLEAAESSTKEPWDYLRRKLASIEQAITEKNDYLRGKLEGMDQLLEERESKLQEKLANFETTQKARDDATLEMECDIKPMVDLIWQVPTKDEYLRDKLNEMDRLLKERESKLQEKLVNFETTMKASHEALLKMERDMKSRGDILHDKLVEYENSIKDSENALKEVVKYMETTENAAKIPTSYGPYKSCNEIPPWKSGIYGIEIDNEIVSVYCEQIYFGGGWIVIQQRFNGEEDFNRDWPDYRNGFGNLSGEFWLGLEYMHKLTSTNEYDLLVECEDTNEDRICVRYSDVKIESRKKGYTLSFEFGYVGESYHNELLHFETARGCRFNVSTSKTDPNGGWWGSPFSMGSLNGCYGTAPNSPDQRKHLLLGFRDVTYSRMSIRVREESILIDQLDSDPL